MDVGAPQLRGGTKKNHLSHSAEKKKGKKGKSPTGSHLCSTTASGEEENYLGGPLHRPFERAIKEEERETSNLYP